LSFDSAYQWWQARHDDINTLAPPGQVLLLQALDLPISAGAPAVLFVCNITLFWVCAAYMAVVQRTWAASLFVLGVFSICPVALVIMPHVWSDVSLAIALFFVCVLFDASARLPAHPRAAATLVALSGVLLVGSALLRHNALLVVRSINTVTKWVIITMLPLQLMKVVIMARKSERPSLVLTPEQRSTLQELSASRVASKREVERAKVMLGYADGISITELQRRLGFSRPMIYRCVDKALAAGIQMGLKDKYHRPHEPEISDEAKAWAVSIACTKPKDHGLAAELWSISELARFVGEHAPSAGFPRLAKPGKSTVWRILDDNDIKPHKIRYYLEKRDPEFDRKMQEVLMVYRDVSLYTEGAVHDARPNPIYTVSVDEKPGVQAIGLTALDLPPVPGKAVGVGRDYEYVRHGTVSILAGIDLHSGHIFANVEDRHRSVEFIGLLKQLDAHYPEDAIIRVVLDNHSTHISKETMVYLSTRPGRFEYVHTPKHGSWLNLIECAFSKMARTFLRHIRVTSKDDLKQRILKGIEEINALPVVFRWNKFDLGVT
jgi:transposase